MTALSRDLRFGGTWTRGQTLKNDLVWTLLRTAIATSNLLPGRAIGRLAAVFDRRARENVKRALGVADAEAKRIATLAYENLGAHLVDVLRALRGAPLPSLPIAPEALVVLDDALREKKGVVFASAHFGPWERVAATLVRHGVPLVTMARESYDPRITHAIDTLRAKTCVPSIYRGSNRSPGKILRALRSGAVLGMPMDLRTRAESIEVPLFGIPSQTVVGPARLAIRTGAPVVVGSAEKIGGALVVTATRLPLGDDDPISLTAALNREIERRIRTAPEEWVWMHPRW